MSLPAEAQDGRLLSTLPVEIVADIIEEACRMLDISSISSIALTSHAFRIHVNKGRFSTLYPRAHGMVHDLKHIVTDIRGLADIIRSGHALGTLPGVCSFATSFNLLLPGYDDKVVPALNDGSLACIFRNLFRAPLHTASLIRSLSLCLYAWSRKEHDGYHAIPWLSMNPELLQEFEALLRKSDITRLRLEGVLRIPNDFLRVTKIKHLYLERVSICPFPENHDTAPYPDHVPLESLDIHIDTCVSTKELGPLVHSLTQLRVIIGQLTMFERLDELLSNTPILQSLTLTLNNNHQYTRHERSTLINYNHLKYLNRISFINSMKTPLSLMVDLLRHDISTVTELEIKLSLRTYDVLEDIERGLKDHKIKLLDSHLVHPAFDSIRRVIIGVEVEMVKYGSSSQPPSLIEKWRSYVESQLPLLLEKKPDTEVYVRWKKPFVPDTWFIQE